MRANEFVKKFGWDEAISLLNAQSWTMRQISLSTLTDLKELQKCVDAYELVQAHGGIESIWVQNSGSIMLRDFVHGIDEAVKLVEECQ